MVCTYEGFNLSGRAVKKTQGLFRVAARLVCFYGFQYLGRISGNGRKVIMNQVSTTLRYLDTPEIHSCTLHESYERVVETDRRAKNLPWLSRKETSVEK